jgi:hypothetical protein
VNANKHVDLEGPGMQMGRLVFEGTGDADGHCLEMAAAVTAPVLHDSNWSGTGYWDHRYLRQKKESADDSPSIVLL